MDTMSPELLHEAESGHTTTLKSVRKSRVEVLPQVDRRRSWTLEQKREIVSESLGSDLTPTEIARKHGISTGQIYTWRQQMLGGQSTLVSRPSPQFAAVELTPAPTLPRPTVVHSRLPSPAPAAGSIEILLPGGVSVRVDADVDSRALRRVLGALQGR